MKYVRVEDLDTIINELKQDAYFGMINYERLIKRLSKVKGVDVPRINNIDDVLKNIKLTIEKADYMYLTKTEISERIKVSRPTLNTYFEIGRLTEGLWIGDGGGYKRYDIRKLYEVVEKHKLKQDKK